MTYKNLIQSLFAILLITEGLLFILSVYKTSKIIGFTLVILGIFIFNKSYDKSYSNSNFKNLQDLLSPFWIKPEFFGLILIISVLSFEYLYSDYNLGNYSLIVLLIGLYIIIFDRIGEKYNYEKYFLLNFLIIYSTLLVFPFFISIILNKMLGNHSELNLFIVEHLLSSPLVLFLNLSGIESIHISEVLSYRDIDGNLSKVHIARECTGIDSVLIFISAYTAYLANHIISNRFLFFKYLAIGILLCYIANILRMYLIILVGYFYGIEALYWTHTNIGWLIFVFWMFIFWRFLPDPPHH